MKKFSAYGLVSMYDPTGFLSILAEAPEVREFKLMSHIDGHSLVAPSHIMCDYTDDITVSRAGIYEYRHKCILISVQHNMTYLAHTVFGDPAPSIKIIFNSLTLKRIFDDIISGRDLTVDLKSEPISIALTRQN